MLEPLPEAGPTQGAATAANTATEQAIDLFEVQDRCGARLIAGSRHLGWQGFCVERDEHASGVKEVAGLRHYALALTVRCPGPLKVHNAEGRYVGGSPPGSVVILPPGLPTVIEQSSAWDSVYVGLEPRFFDAALEEAELSGRAGLSVHFRPMLLNEPRVARLCAALLAAAEDERAPDAALAAESLVRELVVHLARTHGTHAPSRVGPWTGLPRAVLRRVLEHIEAKLGERLSLRQLAQQSGYSPFHFCRMFTRSMGTSPHRYLLGLRVERAREQLRAGWRGDLGELALRLGFSDQAHFSRSFRRAVGLTPSAFRALFV
jgi:AraC family transcriptional regulator